jgi:hypothetical protein
VQDDSCFLLTYCDSSQSVQQVKKRIQTLIASKVPTSVTRRLSKRTMPCPERLSQILERLSWLSLLENFRGTPDNWWDPIRQAIGPKPRKWGRGEMIRHLKGELEIWRVVLNQLAELGCPYDNSGLVFTLPTGKPQSLIGFDITADDAGRAHFTMHESLTVLEGVDVARIRRCRNCGNLFWAGRIDKPTCSVACGNAYRQRKWRESSGKYELNRYHAQNKKGPKK